MMSRKDELIAEGWIRQTTYDEPRLSEMVRMYKEIGLEVHLECFNPDDEPGCVDCMKAFPERFKTIYIREKKEP